MSSKPQKEMLKSGREVTLAWLNAVNGGRIDDVLNLYSRKAILLPTFSPDFISSYEGLRSYFTRLAARPNLRVELREDTLDEQQITSRISVVTGFYAFIFDVDGVTRTFESRFTFAMDLWSANPIMHHHSSVLPDASS